MDETNKLKSVMFVINTLSGGGAERVLSILCNEIASRDTEVYLCFTGKNSKVLPYRLDERVNTIYCYGRYIPKGYDGWFLCRYKLYTAVKRFKPEVIVSFMQGSTLTVLKTFKKQSISLVMAMRGVVGEISQRMILDLSKLFYRIDGAVYMTDEQKKSYNECFLFPKDIMETVITNPILPSPLWNVPRPSKKKEIIAVGRLHYQKNFDMLIRAFSRLEKKFPEWILTIYGDGSYRRELEELIQVNNLTSKVFLPGFVSDIEEKFHEASFFVQTSMVETFGNVLAEAMCLGTPCIAAECAGGGGPRKLIEDGISGVIIENNNEEMLVSAMRRYMEDPSYAQRVGDRAKELRSKHLLPVIVDSWLEFLYTCSKKYKSDSSKGYT